MQVFKKMYDAVLGWSAHRNAPAYLAGVSFAESSVFPIPPDVMLIPMILTKPFKAWEYAAITIIASILGGIFGYILGYFAFEWVGQPIINLFGYQEAYATVVQWFDIYGFWVVLLAGFTPVPYKIFTLAAGASQMALIPFTFASIIGRSIRFLMVVWLVKAFGKRVEAVVLKYIEYLGWGLIALMVVGYAIYKYY